LVGPLARTKTHQHKEPFNEIFKGYLHEYIFNHIERYIYGTILDFLSYQFTILTPLLIYFIAKFLESEDRDIGWALFFLFITPFCRFLRSFFDAHGIFNLSMLGTDISNSIAIGMVNKSMNYSILCNKKFKMGEISSLMQVDCFRMSLFPKSFNSIIFISYVLIFAIVFMAVLVGPAFLAGFGVLFVASAINMVISRYTAQYGKEVAQATDNRMKITTEVFNNIKFIKVNAWEEYFYDKLIGRRN
jgi:ABC-type bacteriocin/lantibiotic exporter with double-glycine peptidase domain